MAWTDAARAAAAAARKQQVKKMVTYPRDTPVGKAQRSRLAKAIASVSKASGKGRRASLAFISGGK